MKDSKSKSTDHKKPKTQTRITDGRLETGAQRQRVRTRTSLDILAEALLNTETRTPVINMIKSNSNEEGSIKATTKR